MKHDIKNKSLNGRVVSLLLSAIITAGCSHGGGSSSPIGGTSSDNVALQNRAVAPLTIDNAGTYPVIKGNVEHTASVWVHNNSDVAITGFSYTKAYNIEDVNMSTKSSAGCSDTVAPHSSCMIRFEIPSLDAQHTSAALHIKAHYKIGNEAGNVDQVVNFAYIDGSSASATGVVSLSKNVVVNSLGNKEGYTTLYLYGTGSRDTIYKINNLKLDNPGLSITNGNPADAELGGGQVIAVEVGGSLSAEQGFDTQLDINSSYKDNSFRDIVRVLSEPVVSSANVVVGFPSLIDVSKKATGNIFIYNAGSKIANITGISSSNTKLTISQGTGNVCTTGKQLGVQEGCSVQFTISGKDNESSNITINYNESGSSSKSSIVTQSWFNSTSSKPNISLVSSVTGLAFKQNTVTENTITVTNIGNVDVTNIIVSQPTTTNGATANIVTGSNTCASKILNPKQQCAYKLSVTDSNGNNSGLISTVVSFSYLNAVNVPPFMKAIVIPYATSMNGANASVIFTKPEPMSIVGDGSESKTQKVILSNLGGAPATITNTVLISSSGKVPQYVIIESNPCGVIKGGESCAVQLKLGATVHNESQGVNSSLQLRVTDNFGKTYTSESFTVTVTPVTVNVSTALPSVSLGITGTGKESNPYVVHGHSTGNNLVTITYTQNGSGKVTLVGVDALTGNNASIWQLDGSSTCLNKGIDAAPNKELSPGNSCTIVYKNVLGQNSAGLTASPILDANIKLPTLRLRTAGSTDFTVTPIFESGSTVYVRNSQATITNFMDVVDPYTKGQSLKVGSTVTNAEGYGDLTVTAKIDKNPLLGLDLDGQPCSTSANESSNQYYVSCQFPSGSSGGTKNNIYAFDMDTIIATSQGKALWIGSFFGDFDVSGLNAPQWLFNGKDYYMLPIPSNMSRDRSCFNINGNTITGLSGSCPAVTELVIPTDITAIGANAFLNNTSLTSVTMPNVTSIGVNAFMSNTKLTSVIMPNVTTIAEQAFYLTPALTSVTMPNVISIGRSGFRLNSLRSINTPLLTTIGYAAFQETKLESVNMPNVKTIGDYAFMHNTALTSVDMPNVTSIGVNAFVGNTALKSVNMPLVTTIGANAFLNCSVLNNVTFGNKTLCQSTFSTNSSICK